MARTRIAQESLIRQRAGMSRNTCPSPVGNGEGRRRRALLGSKVAMWMLAVAVCVAGELPAQAITILKSFPPVDGGNRPLAGLVSDGAGNLYGTTSTSGTSGPGTVFKIAADGSGYTTLHRFGDAAEVVAGLVLDGTGTLFGVTKYGGAKGAGNIFKLKSDGTGFAVLHSFDGSLSDGGNPVASLVLDSTNTLYGTTLGYPAVCCGQSAGERSPSVVGTVFKIKTDGTGYAVLHVFSGEAETGAYPSASVVLGSNGALFGTATKGGAANEGFVYTLKTDGTGFGILHSFVGGDAAGKNPFGAVVLDGGTLYGTTNGGGGAGTVFKLNTDGTGFALLHRFTGSPADGAFPRAGVVLDGAGVLYGATVRGGASDNGALFRIKTDGSGFAVLHSFAGGTSDGAWPMAAVLLEGGALYGTTHKGGEAGEGTIFSLPVGTAYTHEAWLPVVCRTGGIAYSRWFSDLGLLNTGVQRANVELTYFGKGGPFLQTTFVPPGAQSRLVDVVGQLGGSGSGTMKVVSDQPLRISSRTYAEVPVCPTCSSVATVGQDYPALDVRGGLEATQSAYLPGLAENRRFRCNIGLANLGGDQATVLVELYAGDGDKLAEYTVQLAESEWAQETQPFKSKAAQTAMERGYAKITVQSGSGIFAFASLIDNITSDPTTIPMQR
jgi:uncharacterized repeat protein (TIGR03803 family)